MQPVKISLAGAATNDRSVDYLLALAEAGHLQIYGRIGPYSGEYKNQRGEPPCVRDARHGNLEISGPVTVREPVYTMLLQHEAAILRTGEAVAVYVVRQPGAENGVRFPFSGDEEFSLYLTEPQQISRDQVFVDEARLAPGPLPREATGSEAPPPTAAPANRAFQLREPERSDVLSHVIFSVLKDLSDAERPLPSSRQLMRLCQAKNPADVIEVTHNEIKFLNGDGDTAVATLEAVTKRVKRMTSF